MNAPVDRLHADAARARAIVNEDAALIRDRIAEWEPRPAPPRTLPRTCPNCHTRFASHALLTDHARFGACRRTLTRKDLP